MPPTIILLGAVGVWLAVQGVKQTARGVKAVVRKIKRPDQPPRGKP